MFCIVGNGGGSAERKHRNDSFTVPPRPSKAKTKVGSHDCMRCTFCSMTQPPECANFFIVRSALDSWPWPAIVHDLSPSEKASISVNCSDWVTGNRAAWAALPVPSHVLTHSLTH